MSHFTTIKTQIKDVAALGRVSPVAHGETATTGRPINTATLTYDSTGTVRCLDTGLIDLYALGPLEVRRASTIEFNDDHQH